MKVTCLLITHLRAKVEMRRYTDLKDRPAVIVDRSEGRAVVADFTSCATGISFGMTLEEALSIRPEALVIEADEPHYRRVFAQVLASLQGISDRVEGSELDTAYIRLDGLERMYGGEARLVNALLNAVPQDFSPRAGVAEAKFPALVAARMSKPLGATRVPLDAASFLAPHTVDLLPIGGDIKTALHRFGLHTLGDVASLTEADLTDRFGFEGGRAWRLSRGMDDSPVVPLAYAETIVHHASLPFTSASIDLLLSVVDTLLARAFSQPSMRGRHAGKAVLECALERGPTWVTEILFKGGVGSRERALPVIRTRLEEDHPGGPVEEVILTLDDLTGSRGLSWDSFPRPGSHISGDWSRWTGACGPARVELPPCIASLGSPPGTLLQRCGLSGCPSTRPRGIASDPSRRPSRLPCARDGTVNPRRCAWGTGGERWTVSRKSGASICGGCLGP